MCLALIVVALSGASQKNPDYDNIMQGLERSYKNVMLDVKAELFGNEKAGDCNYKCVYTIRQVKTDEVTRDLITNLKTVGPKGVIEIHVNSGGGYVNTLFEIVAAREDTNAKVITYNTGAAYSAAATLALLGDEIKVSDDADFMIHLAWRQTPWGGQTIPLTDPVQIRLIKLKDKIMGKYLTSAQVEGYLSGKDVYIPGDFIERKVDKPNKYQRGWIWAMAQKKIDELKRAVKPKGGAPVEVPDSAPLFHDMWDEIYGKVTKYLTK